MEEEYGKENLLYATVHMDEITPHMHYGVVPITKDGRLSAKEEEFLDNLQKKNMIKLAVINKKQNIINKCICARSK